MRLAVKGWTQFQHYKHRKPPWIRLHRKLIDKIADHCGLGAAAAHAELRRGGP